MLVSHPHRFIYLKTIKTAGTSVEILFESLCCPPGSNTGTHARPQSVTAEGIVGARSGDVSAATIYNHTPAAAVREALGAERFDAYFKWCVVRHPMDWQVSWWWFRLDASRRREYAGGAHFGIVKAAFTRDLLEGPDPLPVDRDIYAIDGRPVVDVMVRHEDLATGLDTVCRGLSLAELPSKLGRFKGGHRQRPESFRAYFEDRAAVRLMLDRFGPDFEQLGYLP